MGGGRIPEIAPPLHGSQTPAWKSEAADNAPDEAPSIATADEEKVEADGPTKVCLNIYMCACSLRCMIVIYHNSCL